MTEHQADPSTYAADVQYGFVAGHPGVQPTTHRLPKEELTVAIPNPVQEGTSVWPTVVHVLGPMDAIVVHDGTPEVPVRTESGIYRHPGMVAVISQAAPTESAAKRYSSLGITNFTTEDTATLLASGQADLHGNVNVAFAERSGLKHILAGVGSDPSYQGDARMEAFVEALPRSVMIGSRAFLERLEGGLTVVPERNQDSDVRTVKPYGCVSIEGNPGPMVMDLGTTKNLVGSGRAKLLGFVAVARDPAARNQVEVIIMGADTASDALTQSNSRLTVTTSQHHQRQSPDPNLAHALRGLFGNAMAGQQHRVPSVAQSADPGLAYNPGERGDDERFVVGDTGSERPSVETAQTGTAGRGPLDEALAAYTVGTPPTRGKR